jgi:predicted oxidoreductase
LYPVHATGKYLFGDEDYVDTWKAMEEVCKKGLTKSIGVSNFNKRQIERVLEKATILPVTNQVSSGSFVDLWELDSGFVDRVPPISQPEEANRILQVQRDRCDGVQSFGIA